MSDQSINEQIKLEAERFPDTDFGKFVIEALESKRDGYLTAAKDVDGDNRINKLDKLSGIEEALTVLKSPLDL